jgi:hypothetical protein
MRGMRRKRLNNKRKLISWDYLGIWLSFLCILHCLVMPVILILAPFYHFYLDQFEFHLGLFVILLLIACWALLRGYYRHRNQRVLVYGLCGLAILLAVALIPHSHETYDNIVVSIINSIGSIFLISAHIMNVRACRHHHTHHHHHAQDCC